jgi:hypothetical protein
VSSPAGVYQGGYFVKAWEGHEGFGARLLDDGQFVAHCRLPEDDIPPSQWTMLYSYDPPPAYSADRRRRHSTEQSTGVTIRATTCHP